MGQIAKQQVGESTNFLKTVVGKAKQLMVDTTRWGLVVMDGVKAGGYPVLGAHEMSNRNTLVNSDGVVAQEAIGTPINDDTYSFDQWITLSDGNGVVTPSQETSDLPNGARSAMKLTVAVANKKFGLLQIVEGNNCKHLINDVATLAASAKASGLSNLRVAVLSWTGTEDSVTSDVVSTWNAVGVDPTLATNWVYENTPVDIALTTTWQRDFKAEGIPIDASSAKQVAVFIWVDDTDAAISDYLLLSNVQLEKGRVVTVFESRTIGEEIALCQRYFSKSYKIDVDPGSVSSAGNIYETDTRNNAGQSPGTRFPVEMRTEPTVVIYSTVTGSSGKVDNLGDKTAAAQRVGAPGIGFVAITSGTTGTFCAYHFTADARL